MGNSILLKDLNFCISLNEVSKKLNLSDEKSIKVINELIKEAEKIAVPKAVFKESIICERGDNFVVLDEVKFTSRVLRVNLIGENRAFPYVVTSGTELKHWCNSKQNKFEKTTAEFITQEILIQCHLYLKNYIEENFNTGNLVRVNPGSTIDWQLKEQENIFSILDDKIKSIDVTLNSSFFMYPEKTYSGIYFHNETDYKNCYMCIANDCPLRERNYDKNYYDKHYK